MLCNLNTDRYPRPEWAQGLSASGGAALEIYPSSTLPEGGLPSGVNRAAFLQSLQAVDESIREQMLGKTFGKAWHDPELYGFTSRTCALPESTRVHLDALYAQQGNAVIREFGASPVISQFQERIVLVVHQMRRMQDETIEFLKTHASGVPAIALICSAFTVDTPRYLEFFKSQESGSGFVVSNGGHLDYLSDNGQSFYRPMDFTFRRIDVAGGFVGLCQKTALNDVIRLRLNNANTAGEVVDLQVNFISSLTYKQHNGGGEIPLLASDLREPTSRRAINNSVSVTMRAIPNEYKRSMLTDWQKGPPYVFEVGSRHRITFTFDAD